MPGRSGSAISSGLGPGTSDCGRAVGRARIGAVAFTGATPKSRDGYWDYEIGLTLGLGRGDLVIGCAVERLRCSRPLAWSRVTAS